LDVGKIAVQRLIEHRPRACAVRPDQQPGTDGTAEGRSVGCPGQVEIDGTAYRRFVELVAQSGVVTDTWLGIPPGLENWRNRRCVPFTSRDTSG